MIQDVRHTRECFSHMETSREELHMLHMLSVDDHLAVRYFKHHPILYGTFVCIGPLRIPALPTPVAEHLAVEMSLPVFMI